jgi:hypothetical protein
MNRSEEAIAVCDEMLFRFASATELPLREDVAHALFNKELTLGEFNRNLEALAVYDEVVARFGSASELPLRQQAIRAVVGKWADK